MQGWSRSSCFTQPSTAETLSVCERRGEAPEENRQPALTSPRKPCFYPDPRKRPGMCLEDTCFRPSIKVKQATRRELGASTATKNPEERSSRPTRERRKSKKEKGDVEQVYEPFHPSRMAVRAQIQMQCHGKPEEADDTPWTQEGFGIDTRLILAAEDLMHAGFEARCMSRRAMRQGSVRPGASMIGVERLRHNPTRTTA